MEITLSVIILNYNHKYFPKLALEALEKSECGFAFEVIFVDNASHDESVPFLINAEKEGRIRFIRSKKNVGFGAGNNLGIKEARGEYVFIHNPDVTVHPDSLQKLVDYLKNHDEIGILAPRLQYSNGEIQESCRRDMSFFDLIVKRTFLSRFEPWKSRLREYLMHDFDHNRIQEVDLVTGAAMVMKRAFLWDTLKGFDERYFLFMEDFDLCKRARETGKKVVYYPDVTINHYHKRLSGGGAFGQFMKKTFWLHTISAIQYFIRWR